MGVEHLNVEALGAAAPDGPVVMLNLMRFRARSPDGNGTGWDAYKRYSAAAVPMIKARGGTVLWAGKAHAVALGAPEAHRWDYAALVRYPSAAAFTDMMTSAEYETASDPHRRDACEEHVILCTSELHSKVGQAAAGGTAP